MGAGSKEKCAACGAPAEGEYSIHRYPDMTGPEFMLCNACGEDEEPTCHELREAIERRLAEQVNSSGDK